MDLEGPAFKAFAAWRAGWAAKDCARSPGPIQARGRDVAGRGGALLACSGGSGVERRVAGDEGTSLLPGTEQCYPPCQPPFSTTCTPIVSLPRSPAVRLALLWGRGLHVARVRAQRRCAYLCAGPARRPRGCGQQGGVRAAVRWKEDEGGMKHGAVRQREAGAERVAAVRWGMCSQQRQRQQHACTPAGMASSGTTTARTSRLFAESFLSDLHIPRSQACSIGAGGHGPAPCTLPPCTLPLSRLAAFQHRCIAFCAHVRKFLAQVVCSRVQPAVSSDGRHDNSSSACLHTLPLARMAERRRRRRLGGGGSGWWQRRG